MKLLCTPPLREHWAADHPDWSFTDLAYDGTVADESIARWDGAMITSESFSLIWQDRENGFKKLGALYQKLADLVTAGRVGWVHLCASGLDVPLFFPLMRAAHAVGATLTHCPGVYGPPIAQYCLAHMLSVARMLPQHRAQQAKGEYTSLVQRDMRNMAVGIIGAGGIGSELARMAKAVGMRTCGWRRAAQPRESFDEMVSGPEGLEQLLRSSDFVVVSLPHTPATRHLLGARELGLMRPTAWLINISRGGVVDEPALIAALQAPSPSAMCPLPRPPPPSPVTGLLRTPATSPALT